MRIFETLRRRFADLLLFAVTLTEFKILGDQAPDFEAVDWIYVAANFVVLVIAVFRRPVVLRDNSIASGIAVVMSYAYSYAQVAFLKWEPGDPAWRGGGTVIVLLGACLSFAGLLTLGRRFGVRPALRGLVTSGPYRWVRNPIYLAYVIEDIGYNLEGWNYGTVLLVAAGWASLVYRIFAEERMLARDDGWQDYARKVRYRLIPGLW